MKNFTLLIIFCLMAFFSSAQQATFNWKLDTIASTNNLQAMTVNSDDGNSVIIGYDNTFLKSTDSGKSWKNKSMFDPDYDFIGMANAKDVIFISSRRTKVIDFPSSGYPDVYVSGVLLKSTDMGATWEALDINSAGFGDDVTVNPNADGGYAKDIYAIAAMNKDTIIGYAGWYDQTSGSKVSRGAVFRTNNGGITWWKLTPDLGSGIISSIEVKDTVAAFGGLKSMYFTNLITDSITNIYPNLAVGTDSNLFVNNITFVSPKEFYVTTTTDGIFKTEDEGKTFAQLPGVTGGSNDLIVINDSTLLVLGSAAKSKLSTDSGATWSDCYPGATCYKIGGIIGDTLYAMANEVAYKCAVADLITKTPSWTTVKLFDGERLQKMAICDDNNAVIAGFGENSMYTSDGGLTWNNSQLPDDYMEDVDFDFNDLSSIGDNAYSTVRRFKIADLSDIDSVQDLYMEGLLLKTEDNWETSTILDASKIGADEGDDPTMNPQLDECWGFNPYTVECVDANTAYVWGNWYEDVTEGKKKDRSRVFKTVDSGDSWTGISPDYGNAYITDIEFSNDTGYIAGNKILVKTTDAGATLIDLYPNMVAVNDGDSSIFLKTIHMISTQEFYIPSTSDGVFITTNGGETFTKFEGVTGTNDIIKLDANSFLCMGLTSKSYFTNDAGATWQNASAGTTAYSIGEILSDTLYALGKGQVMKIALSDLDLETGLSFALVRPGLNVFYEPTAVKLVSTEGDIERCAMYSITGKLVSLTEPNSQTKKFNTSEFPTGIYIVNTIVKGKRYINKISIK
ncbi:T9SS type A sorting domain-containing protein [Prolixibacteraceae bacterium Z1-6]|uniref:T9SS type A sorting domain-containing protein n=1 Tax=Draconibacterium aestuarii TaxID=2998507 RepID=A0A9X3F260_9BACT|nr:T9SS type A sorting domain-containing protein [Prolixibacteraceae bacterium Z1-6]